jgi:predicted CoA-binding protein
LASKRAIDSFLSCRRIAVVGVSRDPKDFSRAVFRAFVHGVHRFFRRLGGRLPS